MRTFFKKHRTLCLTTLTAAVIVLVVGLNILFPFLMQSKGTYPDMTPEGLYTLTDKMKETCGKLKGEITITFCDEPDRLLATYNTRYPYVMAIQLQDQFDNIHVEAVNLLNNPTAVNQYKPTSATVIDANDIIISCGARYRIMDARSFWTIGENATDDSEYYSFNGEYKLASALLSVTSIEEPVVCFAYGHGEHIYVPEDDTANAHLLSLSDPDRSAFYGLVRMAGLKVQYINLDTEDIPEDCVLLVMDGPERDYALGNPADMTEQTALRRIHNFLSREKMGSWMLFKDPFTEEKLENLEDLAEDWGIAFDNEMYVKDDAAHTLPDAEHSLKKLIVQLSQDDETTPYAIYGDLLSVGTPPRMVVENSGAVHGSWINNSVGSSGMINVSAYYFDFMTSSDKAVDVNGNGDQNIDSKDAHAYALAGLSMRMRHDTVEDTTKFSYLFGAASTSLTSNLYLADPAFSNYDVLFATVRFVSRTDEYASMELGGTSLNSPIPGGKPLQSVVIPATGYEKYDNDEGTSEYYPILMTKTSVIWTVVLIAVPVLAAVVTGTVLIVKRRNR